jgi:hypothetical protein
VTRTQAQSLGPAARRPPAISLSASEVTVLPLPRTWTALSMTVPPPRGLIVTGSES